MKPEVETALVNVLDCACNLEESTAGDATERRQASLDFCKALSALFVSVGAEDDTDPGPGPDAGPLINWIWDRAAQSCSTG